MPELPEVETTVRGLQKEIMRTKIIDAWTDYHSLLPMHNDQIKNPDYWAFFKKTISHACIVDVRRRAKLVIIDLDNGYSIVTHMKMTGHYLYGSYTYNKQKNVWSPSTTESHTSLTTDKYNSYIHFVVTIQKDTLQSTDQTIQQIALSDARKFARISVEKTTDIDLAHENEIGPEPLHKDFSPTLLETLLKHAPRNKNIKLTLMDPAVIAGIGNIYSDELLWRANIHPESKTGVVAGDTNLVKALFVAMRHVLASGIDFGGDSMSDYRNIYGERGEFQGKHHAYRRTEKPCEKRSCGGTIQRIVVGGRGTHFCDTHQIKY